MTQRGVLTLLRILHALGRFRFRLARFQIRAQLGNERIVATLLNHFRHRHAHRQHLFHDTPRSVGTGAGNREADHGRSGDDNFPFVRCEISFARH